MEFLQYGQGGRGGVDQQNWGRMMNDDDRASATELAPSEVRAILLDLLEFIDEFCAEHGISYYLYAGTLLGAARHGGFIPWDDDLDVMMARSDYERFCAEFAVARPESLITFHRHPTYPYASAKVSRPGTVVVEEVDLAPADSFGVSVDVLPFDSVSDNRLIFRAQVACAWAVRAVLLLKIVQPSRNRARRVRLMLRLTRFVLAPVPVRLLVVLRDRIAQAWGSRPSEHVAMLIASVPWRVPVSWIVPASELHFEGRRFPAPARVGEFLTEVYGDYMKLPDESRRVPPHLSRAYRLVARDD